MTQARFKVSAELLREMLHMPTTASIIGAEFDDDASVVVFTAYDFTLPNSDGPLDYDPVVTKREYQWDWGTGREAR